MPDHITKLRDKAVASADGGEFSWDDSTKLFDWLTYEGEWVDLNDINCFVPLDHFSLSDPDLREQLELPDDAEITDEVRLAYARDAIDEFNNSGGSAHGSTVVKLTDSLGRETYGCWLSETMGHAVEVADWYGCFPSKEAFFEYLKNNGWWDLNQDVNELSWERLRAAWRQPLDMGRPK